MQEKDGKITKKKLSVFISIIVVIVFIHIIVNNYNSNTLNSSSRSTNKITTTNTTITNYCAASGCSKKGTYSIDGTSGKEYYCYEHYKQMEAWAEMFMGY